MACVTSNCVTANSNNVLVINATMLLAIVNAAAQPNRVITESETTSVLGIDWMEMEKNHTERICQSLA
jgi:hypothetical protein